jgi:hypothetical protein
MHELIRKQLEINVRDGHFMPGTIDVAVGDRWETLPCKYEDGTFTVTTKDGRVLSFRIYVELVREA